jgi:hypothetical protein
MPPELLTRYEETQVRGESAVEDLRIIYLVRIFPGGREGDPYLLPDDALADLARLFEQFRAEGLPNGRYRIHLKEVGLPPRQVIEFYKSGESFGDPVRERGPGSNPIPPGQSAPGPKQEEKATPQAGGEYTSAHVQDGSAGASPSRDEGPAASGAIDAGRDGGADRAVGRRAERSDLSALGHSPGRLVRPLVGALAVSLGALGEAAALEGWAKRVDDALENSPEHGLSRRTRLERRLGRFMAEAEHDCAQLSIL